MSDDQRVMILPCSGIGKAYGSVGREAMYRVLEDLRPNETQTVCLSLLTLGDEQAMARVRNARVITIDGCPFKCAQVNVEHAGGRNAAVFRVFDVYRAHKELKVHSVSELGENGERMAQILAEEIAAKVDELLQTPEASTPASVVVNEIETCAEAPLVEES
jgi:uncharacterized metal-binding protein